MITLPSISYVTYDIVLRFAFDDVIYSKRFACGDPGYYTRDKAWSWGSHPPAVEDHRIRECQAQNEGTVAAYLKSLPVRIETDEGVIIDPHRCEITIERVSGTRSTSYPLHSGSGPD